MKTNTVAEAWTSKSKSQLLKFCLGLRQICQHNKKHNRLECYASIMQHIRCIFQPMELTFMKADRSHWKLQIAIKHSNELEIAR